MLCWVRMASEVFIASALASRACRRSMVRECSVRMPLMVVVIAVLLAASCSTSRSCFACGWSRGLHR